MPSERWLSLSTSIYFWAAGTAAIAGVIAVLSGYAQNKLNAIISDRKDREFAVYKQSSDERIAELQKELATARAQIAEAQARAAEATQKTREAEVELEKLERPRTLFADKQQFIADEAHAFAGQRYKVAISPAADDGPALWELLRAALQKADWIYLPQLPGQPSVGVPPAAIPITAIPGIEILLDPTNRTGPVADAALALGNALHSLGMEVAVNTDQQINPAQADRDIIQIRIGARVPSP